MDWDFMTECAKQVSGTHQTTGTSKRFELEQLILGCWNITEDIETLRYSILDRAERMSEDEIDNYLLGLKSIYNAKFAMLFDLFEEMVSKRSIT